MDVTRFAQQGAQKGVKNREEGHYGSDKSVNWLTFLINLVRYVLKGGVQFNCMKVKQCRRNFSSRKPLH